MGCRKMGQGLTCIVGRGTFDLTMAKLIALYKTPVDPAAFDAYYHAAHLPLAKTIPGLRGYDISHGPVGGMGGPTGIHLVATLHFDDLAAIGAAMASPQGQATAADLAKFATGGVDVMFFDTVDV